DKNIKGVFEYEYNVNGKKLLIVFNVNNDKVALNNVDLSHGKKLLDSDGNVKLSDKTMLAPLSTLVVDEDGTMVLPDVPKPDQPVSPTTPGDKPGKPTTPENPRIPDQKPANPIVPQETIITPEAPSENSIIDNTKNIINGSEETTTVSTQDNTTTEILLTHNAYVYDSEANPIYQNDNKLVLKAGDTIKPLDNGKKYSIKGKLFYKVAKNQFVKVANTVSYYKLAHNSFVYNKHGKAVKKNGKRILLKKNKHISLHSDKVVKIKGKKFYQLKDGSFIKARNVKRIG
ncbi:MAG: SLAP domain-containing protein, partial [Lactobacillus crispatus]|nr:SLAP domain-containing protein [Lactobacillus crispatus]